MKVLAIESSCDDTSIAVVNDDKSVEFLETINHRKFHKDLGLSLIHISEPTRQEAISYAVF